MKGKETHFPVTFKVFDNMIHLVDELIIKPMILMCKILFCHFILD